MREESREDSEEGASSSFVMAKRVKPASAYRKAAARSWDREIPTAPFGAAVACGATGKTLRLSEPNG